MKSSKLNEEFIDFCSNPDYVGSVSQCYEYLKKDIDLEYETSYANTYNYYGTENETALMRLARVGDIARVKVLMQHNVNINHIRPDGVSSLMIAAFSKNEEMVQFLINNGADVDHAGAKGNVFHFWRIQNPNSEVLKQIISLKKDFNSLGEDNNHGLMKLIETGLSLENLKMMHEKGANIHAINRHNHNLVLLCAYMNYFDLVEYLIEHNADVNQSRYSQTMGYGDIYTFLEKQNKIKMSQFIEKILLEKNTPNNTTTQKSKVQINKI
jgi:ankyrin repeat protein